MRKKKNIKLGSFLIFNMLLISIEFSFKYPNKNGLKDYFLKTRILYGGNYLNLKKRTKYALLDFGNKSRP